MRTGYHSYSVNLKDDRYNTIQDLISFSSVINIMLIIHALTDIFWIYTDQGLKKLKEKEESLKKLGQPYVKHKIYCKRLVYTPPESAVQWVGKAFSFLIHL